MLQFWKKNSRKNKSTQSTNDQHSTGEPSSSLPVGVLLPTLCESNLEGPLLNFEHDGYSDIHPPQSSRLDSNLEETLQDEVAVNYFSQFAELRGYSPLFTLWLEMRRLFMSISPEYARTSHSSPENSFTSKDLCDRHLTEDIIQRFRLPEDVCASIKAAANKDIINGQAIQQLQDCVYHILSRELWNDFAKSEYFSKFQVEVLTSGNVTLSDIVYHSTALRSFTEFLEQEGCQSVMEFWQTATAFQRQLGPDSDPVASQNEAISIYDKYLSLQATCPLGVDHATRCEVEQRICVEDSILHSDCLEPAVRRAWGYLRYVCLPIFLSSQSYVQLISELMKVSKVNSSPGSSMTDISVDSSHSRYDPDNIWRRRRQPRGLSIGRIDQLGRFETDIEPEPDRKSESRITRVVKRLVNKDEQKAQEEMAWRVAEMIVNDVINLTMGGQAEEEET